jgi:hypothetical protein
MCLNRKYAVSKNSGTEDSYVHRKARIQQPNQDDTLAHPINDVLLVIKGIIWNRSPIDTV